MALRLSSPGNNTANKPADAAAPRDLRRRPRAGHRCSPATSRATAPLFDETGEIEDIHAATTRASSSSSRGSPLPARSPQNDRPERSTSPIARGHAGARSTRSRASRTSSTTSASRSTSSARSTGRGGAVPRRAAGSTRPSRTSRATSREVARRRKRGTARPADGRSAPRCEPVGRARHAAAPKAPARSRARRSASA